MGRPTERARINQVIFRLSEAEMTTLEEVCKHLNCTMSDAIRISLKATRRAIDNGLLDVEAQLVGEELNKVLAERKNEAEKPEEPVTLNN